MAKKYFNHGTGLTAAALALLVSGLLVAGGPSLAGELRATINGVTPNGGAVMVALFDSQAAFDSDKRFAALITPPPITTTSIAAFVDIPEGRYMVAVYQDTNGDGQLNKNIIGIPTEAYGFGGDPKSSFGPPAFDDAAITVGETATVATTATLSPR